MPPSSRIGPLEVLRVALMRGDLDDVRNDMARALAWNAVPPEVLESLLYGLEGLGIDLSEARTALGNDPTSTSPLSGKGSSGQGRGMTQEVRGGEKETQSSGAVGQATANPKLSGASQGPWPSTKENHAQAPAISTPHVKPAGRRRRRASRKVSSARR